MSSKLDQAKATVSLHGIQERFVLESDTELELAREELFYKGFTVIQSNLNSNQIQELKDKVQTIHEQQLNEVELERQKIIGDDNSTRCLVAYDQIFIDLATDKNLIQLMRKSLSENFILCCQNGVVSKPKLESSGTTKWHRDLNYQHWTSSKPLAFNALFCVDDFTNHNGSTYVLPYSHLFDSFPSDSYVLKHQEQISAKSGSFIVMNAMTYHRTGNNFSKTTRLGINHIIGLPFISQQIDIPSMLKEKPRSEFLQNFLGYRWNPARSVTEFREQRITRANQDV